MRPSIRNKRNIVRHRRRGTIPTLSWRMPSGIGVTVTRSPFRADRASYNTANATVYGPWPVTPAVMREVQRWV